MKDDKTCKDLGPALKHKLQAQNKKVVEEFDRAKQRMYKRYERALDPNKKASKRDLSYAEYYECWKMQRKHGMRTLLESSPRKTL